MKQLFIIAILLGACGGEDGWKPHTDYTDYARMEVTDWEQRFDTMWQKVFTVREPIVVKDPAFSLTLSISVTPKKTYMDLYIAFYFPTDEYQRKYMSTVYLDGYAYSVEKAECSTKATVLLPHKYLTVCRLNIIDDNWGIYSFLYSTVFRVNGVEFDYSEELKQIQNVFRCPPGYSKYDNSCRLDYQVIQLSDAAALYWKRNKQKTRKILEMASKDENVL
jgi:hypothetical protein